MIGQICEFRSPQGIQKGDLIIKAIILMEYMNEGTSFLIGKRIDGEKEIIHFRPGQIIDFPGIQVAVGIHSPNGFKADA